MKAAAAARTSRRTEKQLGSLAALGALARDWRRTEKQSGSLAALGALARDCCRTEKQSGSLAALAPDWRRLGCRLLVCCVISGALTACRAQDQVVARVGDRSLTSSEVRKKFAALRPDLRKKAAEDSRGFVLSLLEDEVLFQEAQRRPELLKPAAGTSRPKDIDERTWAVASMKGEMHRALTTESSPKDVTDEEMMPFYKTDPRFRPSPEQATVVLLIFARSEDARAAAAEARKGQNKLISEHEFRALFARRQESLRARKLPTTLAETWDVSLAHGSEAVWPKAVVEAAFAAKPGEVIGPITGESPRYQGPRHYVGKVLFKSGASNTFAQVRGMLQMDVYQLKIMKQVKERVKTLTAKNVTIDEAALGALGLTVPASAVATAEAP